MQELEQLGAFYLGKRYDLDRNESTDERVLYDARDLTTHAVCLGMTGSGKTGLGIALLEEAAIDGIPSLVIDPKGDMGNLLLNFPGLAPSDFEPWIDPDEAEHEYGIRPIKRLRDGVYDAAVLAVAHKQFREMGIASVRKACKKSHVVYDIKYLFSADHVDGRL